MNYQTLLFVLGALAFGYYAGYAWRSISDPTEYHDNLATIWMPAMSIFFIACGLSS
jgi:hypothetical protein